MREYMTVLHVHKSGLASMLHALYAQSGPGVMRGIISNSVRDEIVS
jgi:hypothetical protein